jgi:hypothetical protein
MTSTQHKRLNNIETCLMPKEWAIRLLDEERSYPTAARWLRDVLEKSPQDLLMEKGFAALAEQAEQRHPGNKPEAIQARNQLRWTL